MTLAPVESSHPARWAAVLAPAAELARAIADTDFVPRALQGNPGAITACILFGDELGIGPIQALQSIHVIEGKPTPGANLIRALVLREGHSFLIHEASGTRCVVSGLRRGRPEAERTRVSWDLDMARSAGLLNKAVWQRYPRAMLVARATSELGQQVFPDVMRGLGGIAEDLDTVDTTEGWQADPVPPAEPRKRVARKRASPRKEIQGGNEPSGHTTPDDGPRYPEPSPPAPSEDVPLPAELVDRVAGTPVAPEPVQAPEPAPWPELPPTPPKSPQPAPTAATAPTKPPAAISDDMRKRVMASFGAAGIEASNRELRLAVTAAIIGRTVESSNELTRSEGLQLIGTLADVASGAAGIAADSDGVPKIVSLREEPEVPGNE